MGRAGNLRSAITCLVAWMMGRDPEEIAVRLSPSGSFVPSSWSARWLVVAIRGWTLITLSPRVKQSFPWASYAHDESVKGDCAFFQNRRPDRVVIGHDIWIRPG